MSTVCFTGHRIIKVTDEIQGILTAVLEDLIENGADVFYAGGAVGWDMLCEQCVLKLRRKYPHIKLKVILPCPAEEQTSDWDDKDRFEYSEILMQADSREIVSRHYEDGCMKKRNQRLVELADCCVCWHNESISM